MRGVGLHLGVVDVGVVLGFHFGLVGLVLGDGRLFMLVPKELLRAFLGLVVGLDRALLGLVDRDGAAFLGLVDGLGGAALGLVGGRFRAALGLVVGLLGDLLGRVTGVDRSVLGVMTGVADILSGGLGVGDRGRHQAGRQHERRKGCGDTIACHML